MLRPPLSPVSLCRRLGRVAGRSLAAPRLSLSLVVAVLVLLLTPSVASALVEESAPLGAPATPATVFSSDKVIVQWAPGANHGDRVEAREEAGVEFAGDLGNRNFQLVSVAPGQGARRAIGELKADPAVVLAERDGYRALNAIPDDPLFDQLWGLRNLGLGVGGVTGAVAGSDVGATAAWDRSIGDPATVIADIDSGYRFDYPDLAAVAWTNPDESANGLDDDGNGIADDLHGADFIGANGQVPVSDGDPTDDDLESGGHGVHTAGTMGAAGNDGVGITGVAQDVRIMPLRACSRFPSLDANRCAFSAIVAAINYAGAKGARAANMSLGGNTFTQAEVNAIAANPDVLYVISAGNDGGDNDGGEAAPHGHHYPCDYRPPADASPADPGAIDNVVCVAASDQSDRLASFSDWGASSVDLATPGTETLSAYPFVTPLADDFSGDDFSSRWPATGADGGFERSEEAPLTSFGITDAIGAPTASSVREITSAAVNVPPNGGCKLSQTRRVVLGGAQYRYSVLLNGLELVSASPPSSPGPGLERRFIDLGAPFEAGGSVRVRFRFTTGTAPDPDSGVWLDDVAIVCAQAVGQGSAYGFLQGTSMAAPHVTGAAGLLFSLQPSASVNEVRAALLAGVDAIPSLAGKTTTGGRLDIAKAMDSLEGLPVDNVAPPKPTLTGTVPPSGSDDNQPRITGVAEAGASVNLFKGLGCQGSPIATGTAAELAGPGIEVTVPDNFIAFFSARATDAARNKSTCSAPTSYLEDSPPPIIAVPPDREVPNPIEPTSPSPPSLPPQPQPACTVPKLAGKALAPAKAALASAGCTLGRVVKPKPRKGKRRPALVVKSTTPAAGTATAGPVGLQLGPKPKVKKAHR